MNSVISEVNMKGYFFFLAALPGVQIKLVIKNINDLIQEYSFQIQFCKNALLWVGLVWAGELRGAFLFF